MDTISFLKKMITFYIYRKGKILEVSVGFFFLFFFFGVFLGGAGRGVVWCDGGFILVFSLRTFFV